MAGTGRLVRIEGKMKGAKYRELLNENMLRISNWFEGSPSNRTTTLSTQALSVWMGSVAAQLFSGLSRNARSGSSPGSGWATQGHSDLYRNHSLVVCLGSLSCWKVNLRPSRRAVNALERVFIKDLSVLRSAHLCLDPD